MKKTTSASVIRYIDDTTAQVTKAFEKKACIFGTEEFKLWREYKAMFPNAKMVTKSINKNPNQKNRRNMTFKNMEEYIQTQPNAKELEEEFKTIKKRSKIQKSPYQYVLSWFEASTTWISSWPRRKPSARQRKLKTTQLPTKKKTTNQPAKSERR